MADQLHPGFCVCRVERQELQSFLEAPGIPFAIILLQAFGRCCKSCKGRGGEKVLHGETQAGVLPKSKGSVHDGGLYSPRLYFR